MSNWSGVFNLLKFDHIPKKEKPTNNAVLSDTKRPDSRPHRPVVPESAGADLVQCTCH